MKRVTVFLAVLKSCCCRFVFQMWNRDHSSLAKHHGTRIENKVETATAGLLIQPLFLTFLKVTLRTEKANSYSKCILINTLFGWFSKPRAFWSKPQILIRLMQGFMLQACKNLTGFLVFAKSLSQWSYFACACFLFFVFFFTCPYRIIYPSSNITKAKLFNLYLPKNEENIIM